MVDGDLHLPDVDIPTFDTAALDPALWIFSGGTTGLPKAVVQTHRSFANTTELYGKGILGLTAEDVTIAVPKLYFGYAMGSNLFFPFSVGASAVLFPDQSTAGRPLRPHRETPGDRAGPRALRHQSDAGRP